MLSTYILNTIKKYIIGLINNYFILQTKCLKPFSLGSYILYPGCLNKIFTQKLFLTIYRNESAYLIYNNKTKKYLTNSYELLKKQYLKSLQK